MTIGNSMLYHDGDYIFTGYTVRDDTVFSIVTKLDTEGELIWETLWYDMLNFSQIIETADSGIAVCGYRRNMFKINKYNIEGEELYSWQFEFEFEPIIHGLLNNGNDGYIVAGYTEVDYRSRYDFMLVEVSSEREIEWQRIYEDRPRDQECYALTAVPDGGYMLVGRTRENDFGNEINVIRTDEEGGVIWQEHYGTEYIDIPANEGGHDIIATDDGNFLIAGETIAHDDQDEVNLNFLMLKINDDGDVHWMEVIDLDRRERCRSIKKTVDGGFVLSGFSSVERTDIGNPLILKTDNRGILVWSYVQEAVSANTDAALHLRAIAHEDRTFSLVNASSYGVRGFPGFLQKFGRDPHGVSDGNNVFLPSWTGLESAYPNPFNSITTFVFTVGSPADVEISIFNRLGRRQAELVRRSYPIGQHRLSWDAGGLPSGDYFARMTAGEVVSTKKVALIK